MKKGKITSPVQEAQQYISREASYVFSLAIENDDHVSFVMDDGDDEESQIVRALVNVAIHNPYVATMLKLAVANITLHEICGCSDDDEDDEEDE